MLSFINHIQSVSKYESKLLVRSWFFRLFILGSVFFLTIFNMGAMIFDDSSGFWSAKAITSNIAYLNLLVLNVAQAIVSIFLASDFMKRDKKLDTSEVFYVRPLSNAEYMLGKVWGNLRVFFFVNLIIMGISILMTLASPDHLSVDWMAYPFYLMVISVPTLVFIIGLSVFLMLILKNQALTFILLLGYIGVTIFYISDTYYYLFDYMAFYLPMVKSTIVGFTNLDAILTHRAIYLFAGLGFISLTISLFMRLPNSSRSNYPWVILSVGLFLLSGAAGYRHVHRITAKSSLRALYKGVNNRYLNTAKMVVDRYDITVEQYPDSLTAEAHLTGVALESAEVFAFCLNPTLQVQGVKAEKGNVTFRRDEQILLVDMGRTVATGDTISLSIQYGGRVDDSFCYLDISDEKMQEKNKKDAFGCDKAYSFQTDNYLLLTPETYWYPRPGTSYSDKASNWQQTYFSQYHLVVHPLPNLIALSQGQSISGEDGSFSFSPEHPIPALSLLVGKYKQQKLSVDSTLFSIWYIEGHDYYSASFDSIYDTIPALLRNFKENIERTYKLPYPFNRFSLVEVPAQFYSYPHAWTQAQEVIQPEMILMVEKGWTQDRMEVNKRVKSQHRWASYSGQEISEKEAQIRTFNDVIALFKEPEGGHIYSWDRGESSVVKQMNPYFAFPLLYNFQYNIFSPEWSIANKIVELYLQNNTTNISWERGVNGISNNEKVNLLMEKYSFRELLVNVIYNDLQSNMIGLKARELFAPAEIRIGINAFRDSVYAILDQNSFRNVQLESLLDILGALSHTPLRESIAAWYEAERLPRYRIQPLEVTKVSHRGKDQYVTKLWLSNDADVDGIIHLNIQEENRQAQVSDPITNRNILIPAHQTKQIIFIRDDAPREITINTLASGNLPNLLTLPIDNIKQGRGVIMEKEGDYVVDDVSANVWGEVIVDNEDSLFSVSEAEVIGLLPKLLNSKVDTSFKYASIPRWRPPLKWIPTTNAGYYGKYIRSAYLIKSGNGNQTATWKVPVPSEGYYEVYYYVFRDEDIKNSQQSDPEYHLRIQYGDESEEVYLNLANIEDGWQPLGAYYFATDSIRVVLSNECKLRCVTADAVKIVKR